MIQKASLLRKFVATVTLLSFLSAPASTSVFATAQNTNSEKKDVDSSKKPAVGDSLKSYTKAISDNSNKIKELEKSYKELCENAPREKYVQEHKKVIGEQQSNSQCDAIKQSLKAAKMQDALWKVWGATAAVCLSTCMMSIVPNHTAAMDKIVDKESGELLTKKLSDELGTCSTDKSEKVSKLLKDNKAKIKKAEMYYPEICMSMNAAVSLADGIATKQLMSAVMGLATSGLSGAISSQLLSKGPKFLGKSGADECATKLATKETGELSTNFDFKDHKDMVNKDYGSCMVGLQALMQMGMKIKGAQDNKNNAKKGLTEVAKLLDTNNLGQSEKANTYSGTGVDAQNVTAAVNQGQTSADKSTSVSNGATNNSSDPCSNGSTSASVISCALASNHQLPYILRGSKFKNTLQNVTGMSADKFFDKLTPENASSIIAGAATGQIYSGKELAGPFEKMAEKGIKLGMNDRDNDSNSTYRTASARGAKAADTSSEPDLSHLVDGVLGKLGADGKEEKEEDKNPELVFEKEKALDRSLASDDNKSRGFNIFQRISRRYKLLEF